MNGSLQFATLSTSWGVFGFVARNGRLVATFLPRNKERVADMIRKAFPLAVENPKLLPAFQKQLGEYFAGKAVRFSVDIDLADAPPFHRSVLAACRRVDYGQTVSYGQLARKVGNPRAARAVGQAMARNPLPLVVPCHRVLHSDETLGGFSSPGGLSEKEKMLRLEGAW